MITGGTPAKLVTSWLITGNYLYTSRRLMPWTNTRHHSPASFLSRIIYESAGQEDCRQAHEPRRGGVGKIGQIPKHGKPCGHRTRTKTIRYREMTWEITQPQ